ncbi:MAG TPA: hypothetical protein VM367_03540 [Pseudonocardia sp.]|nr:hypothetical protein [Pseudonocardia sp.]
MSAASAARPSTFGLLVWESGLPHLPWRAAPDSAWTTSPLGARVPPTVQVDGVMWAPDSGGVRLGLLTRTHPITHALADRWSKLELFAFADIVLPLLDPVPMTSRGRSSGLVAALGATWLLMAQPTVADARPLHRPVDAGAPASRRDHPERGVTLIDLRRAATAPAEPSGDHPGRVYRHRWLVRGHWRQQAVGPGRTQRRPVYVPPHLKGPDGAPLLEREQVNVWRR